MKQFLLRATIVVAVLLLGWWSFELAGVTAAPARPDGAPLPLVVADAAAASEPTVPLERQGVDVPAATSPGIAFVGRCVAAETGHALSGVQAVAYFDLPMHPLGDNELGRATPAGLAGSDAEGRFCIQCERRPGAKYDVRIGSREHVLRVRTFGPYAADQTVDLGEVPLTRGVQVSLRVVDRRGVAVPGVRGSMSPAWPMGRNDVLMLKLNGGWRSDAQGEVHLPYSLRPGHYDVTWASNELPQDRYHASFEVPADVTHCEAVLVWPVEDLAAAITGDVMDDQGRPIGDLILGAEGGGTHGNTRTLTDGTFRVPRIGPYDENQRGPVEFGLPEPGCGLEIVGQPACSWGDRGVHLIVRPAAVLHVRAIDAATGAAVSDFDVACAAHLAGADAPAVIWDLYSPLERLPDGSVRRRVPRCPHDVQVFPRNARLLPSLKVTWDPREGEDLLVRLDSSRTCTVRVVTLDGEPVAGTELWTLQPIEAVAGAPPAAGWQEVAVPGAEEQRLEPHKRWGRHGIGDAPLGTARTDAGGRAQIVVPQQADVVIAALGPGHVPKALVGRPSAGDEVEFRVDRGAHVRFVLTPKEVVNRLAESAQHRRIVATGTDYVNQGGVVLALSRVAAEQDPARPEGVVIPIPADGVCEQCGLRPGHYDLAVGGLIWSGAMDGIEVLWQPGPVSIRDGQPNEIPLDVSRLAVGRVQCQVLLNGQPWAFGTGHLWSCDWPDHRNIVRLQTDAEGRFDVEAVPGEYRLGLLDVMNRAPSGECCAKEPVQVVAGATRQFVLTARAVRARVRVVQASGEPAAGLEATTDYPAGRGIDIAWTTDADGWISIPLVSPMPFHLLVASPNGPVNPLRRSQSSGDAVLGPFQIPPTGDSAEFRAILPEGWR